MAHRRTAAAIISVSVALVTLAACGSSSHRTAPPTSSRSGAPTTDPSSVGTATTASPSGTTTTTVLGPSGSPATYPAAQPTPPSLAGAYPTGTTVNLVTVLKTLATYRDWVWSHPNPALVANYSLANGTGYASEVRTVTELERDGLHADPTPTEILWVKVEVPATPQHIGDKYLKRGNYQDFLGGDVTVVYNIKPVPLLTASGQPSGKQFNPTSVGQVAYSISLVQGPDGRFRFEDTTQLHPPGGIPSIEHPT
jgi:hypothetical protein